VALFFKLIATAVKANFAQLGQIGLFRLKAENVNDQVCFAVQQDDVSANQNVSAIRRRWR